MHINITDYRKVINKNSVVELKVDGVDYSVDYVSYSFSESENPALNRTTNMVDSRYTSTTELKFNAIPKDKEID